jgi:hypothetical protein
VLGSGKSGGPVCLLGRYLRLLFVFVNTSSCSDYEPAEGSTEGRTFIFAQNPFPPSCQSHSSAQLANPFQLTPVQQKSDPHAVGTVLFAPDTLYLNRLAGHNQATQVPSQQIAPFANRRENRPVSIQSDCFAATPTPEPPVAKRLMIRFVDHHPCS